MSRKLWILFKAQLQLEYRACETAVVAFSLSLLLSAVIAFGVSSAFLEPISRDRLFPTLLWITFILAASVAIGRSYEHELELKAMDGLLLTGVPPSVIFLAKNLANYCLLLLNLLAVVIFLTIFLNPSYLPSFGPFSLIALLTTFAFSSLSTLLGGISISSRLRHILLPLIMLPLLFPLFFCAIELTSAISQPLKIPLPPFWLLLLIFINLLYLSLGLCLYRHIIRE